MRITGITYSPACHLLRITTDEADEGWSPGIEPAAAQAIIEIFEPLAIGCPVWERDLLWRQCREAGRGAGLTPGSWGSVDIALWDLFAKAQDLPLFRAIGGFRDRVPAVRRGERDVSMEDHIEAATAARDTGLFGYIVRATREADLIDALPSLREAVGNEFRLLYDGEQAFELEQALAVGRALERIDAHWFAEPLCNGDVTGLQKLSDSLDIPVAAGAFMGDSILAGTRALTSRAVDRVRATIPQGGGITDALKLARGAEALQMNCEIEWKATTGPHAAAHLLGAVRNAEFFATDGVEVSVDGFHPMSIIKGELVLPAEAGLGLRPVEPTQLTD